MNRPRLQQLGRVVVFLPLSPALILFTACCAGLIWVFAEGLQEQPEAIGLYALSGYSLLTVCCKLPGGIRRFRFWMARHPKLLATLRNQELRFRFRLYRGQLVNFCYGGYKVAAGGLLGSGWMLWEGIYNLTQALIQLFLILQRRKNQPPNAQWRAFRRCGGLMVLLHLSMACVVFQTIGQPWAGRSGLIPMIATAVFAFYKLAGVLVRLIRARSHRAALDLAVSCLELAQALFSIFSLQVGMLHTFGSDSLWAGRGNLAVGCLICLLTAALGVRMRRIGQREIQTQQEDFHERADIL